MEIHDLAILVKAVAWPMVALTAMLLFRSEARSLISMLTLKIERAKRMKLLKGMVDLVDEVARNSISSERSASTATGQPPADEFEMLAKQYDDLNEPDLKMRVATRQRLANRLGELALSLKKLRGELAETTSEGKLVALATAIVLKPMASDLDALEKAAAKSGFNFTRYRLGLALAPALSKTMVKKSTLKRVAKILDDLEQRPNAPTDEPLQRLIDGVRATVAALSNE